MIFNLMFAFLSGGVLTATGPRTRSRGNVWNSAFRLWLRIVLKTCCTLKPRIQIARILFGSATTLIIALGIEYCVRHGGSAHCQIARQNC